MDNMYDIIQDALDDLTSIRSSLSRKGRALNTLEHLIADIYVPKTPTALAALQTFVSLQDTFQCNVPSRLLLWISETSSRLDTLIGDGSIEPDRFTEVSTLSTQLGQAFSIVQGIVLSHEGSKKYLGRRRALEILVHVFIVSRRVPTKNATSRSVSTPTVLDAKDKEAPPPSLSSTILDTLSCILVDSSPSLRAFEEVNGVKAVVKILKRQGTSREVKIKCMEFLYFYVNAESPAWTGPVEPKSDQPKDRKNESLVPTAQSSPAGTRPTHRPTRSLSRSTHSSPSLMTPARILTRRPSLSPATSDSSPASPDSVNLPKPTALELIREEARDDVTSTPKKKQPTEGTPVRYPKTPRKALQPLNISHHRLSRDNEALLLETPAQQRMERLLLNRIATPNALNPSRGHKRAQSSIDILMSSPASPPPMTPPPSTPHGSTSGYAGVSTRTMEEKKEILRGMMSNVDALLEGMNKVGIWGLA